MDRGVNQRHTGPFGHKLFRKPVHARSPRGSAEGESKSFFQFSNPAIPDTWSDHQRQSTQNRVTLRSSGTAPPSQLRSVQEARVFFTLLSSFPLTNWSPAAHSSPVLFKAPTSPALFTSCFGYQSRLPRSLPGLHSPPTGFMRHELVR